MAAVLALPKTGCGHRRSDRDIFQARSGLARVPGLRREHRVVPARESPDRGRGHPRHDLAQLPRDHHGGGRRASESALTSTADFAGNTSPWSRGRFPPVPTVRTAPSADRAPCRSRGSVRQGGGDHRGGHLRHLRGSSGGAPNPTGALSVGDAVPGLKNLINLPACPMNAENMTALLVYYLTFQRWPPLDGAPAALRVRKVIHDNCERRAHFDAGQYVEAWGDEGHRPASACTRWAARGRSPSRTVRQFDGMRARTGPSGAATRVSAARSRTSGTR